MLTSCLSLGHAPARHRLTAVHRYHVFLSREQRLFTPLAVNRCTGTTSSSPTCGRAGRTRQRRSRGSCSGVPRQLISPHTSPYLPHISSCSGVPRQLISPHISPYLPISPHISPISRAAGERVRQGARRTRRPETAQRDSAAVPAADSGPLSPGRPTPPPHTSPCLPRRCQPPIPAGKQQELSHLIARPSPISWAVHRASAHAHTPTVPNP